MVNLSRFKPALNLSEYLENSFCTIEKVHVNGYLNAQGRVLDISQAADPNSSIQGLVVTVSIDGPMYRRARTKPKGFTTGQGGEEEILQNVKSITLIIREEGWEFYGSGFQGFDEEKMRVYYSEHGRKLLLMLRLTTADRDLIQKAVTEISPCVNT